MIPIPATSAGSSSHVSGLSDDDSLMPTPTATPAECFITTESELEAAGESCEYSSSRVYTSGKGPHDAVRRPQLGSKRKANMADIADTWLPSPSTASCGSSEAGHAVFHQDYLQPLTPGLASLSGHESAISSISSRRNSLTASSLHDSFPPSLVDFAAQQGSPSPVKTTTSSGPGPQLIMPSLAVPQRRSFSVTGRSLGKLKILITGSASIGKTSLIQSMAQSCEHIVHIDPINSTTASGVAEVFASTKPHTWWQTSSNSTSASRRRRSSTDEILSRNICFVETSSPREAGELDHPVTKYLESQLLPLLNKSIGDSDLTCVLSSGAEPIVDAVLYLLPFTGPTPTELEYIQYLSTMTNIIPLVSRADELFKDVIYEAKERVSQALDDQGIECFSFTDSRFCDAFNDIYAVSSAGRPDSQVMDASILMSSDYMPPLQSSDLGKLVDRIFSPEGSAQLRHSAALKCVQWRQKQGIDSDLAFAICHRRRSLNYAVTPVLTANPYGQHPFWKRVEISNWAQDLRQSLEGERLRRMSQFTMSREGLQHETAAQMLLVSRREGHRKGRQSSKRSVIAYHQDPLGLLQLVGRIQHGGQLSLEILSSIGALGCLVAWLCRSGADTQGDMIRWAGLCSAL